MITCKDGVIDMLQINFELAGREFGGRRAGRYVLCLTRVIQVVQKPFDFPEVVGAVDLRSRL